jgi:hypothetical protein
MRHQRKFTRQTEIHDFLETRNDVERVNILRKYRLCDLSACISAFNAFMLWSEALRESLYSVGEDYQDQ